MYTVELKALNLYLNLHYTTYLQGCYGRFIFYFLDIHVLECDGQSNRNL